jgi:hypothetical protein
MSTREQHTAGSNTALVFSTLLRVQAFDDWTVGSIDKRQEMLIGLGRRRP